MLNVIMKCSEAKMNSWTFETPEIAAGFDNHISSKRTPSIGCSAVVVAYT